MKKIFNVIFLFIAMLAVPISVKAESFYSVRKGDVNEGTYPADSIIEQTGDGIRVFYHYGKNKTQYVKIYTVSSNNAVSEKKTLALSGDSWGGCVYQNNGYYYMLTGYNNEELSDTKTVYELFKYNASFQLVSKCAWTGKETYTQKANLFGGATMAAYKNYLIITTQQQRYDGHQSNCIMIVNTNNMQKIYYNGDRCFAVISHIMGHESAVEGKNYYYVPHSDGPYRGISISKFETLIPDYLDKNISYINNDGEYLSDEYKIASSEKNLTIIKASGNAGVNTTRCTVGGFETSANTNLVAGTAIFYDKTADWFNCKNTNVFLSIANKENTSQNTKWLTNYADGSNYAACNVQLTKAGQNQYLLTYGIVDFKKEEIVSTVAAKVDEQGNILYKKEIPYGFYITTKPIFQGNTLSWVYTSNNMDGGGHAVLYKWDITADRPVAIPLRTGIDTGIKRLEHRESRSYDKGTIWVTNGKTAEVTFEIQKSDGWSGTPVLCNVDNGSIAKTAEQTFMMNSSYEYMTVHITGMKEGTTTLSILCGDKTLKYPIKVAKPLSKITFDKTSYTMKPKTEIRIKTSFNPPGNNYLFDSASGPYYPVEWKSSNTSIATITPAGWVLSKKEGTVTITASCYGISHSAKVTVKADSATKKDTSTTIAKLKVKKVKAYRPTIKSVKKKSKTSLRITWKRYSYATGYRVLMSTKKNSGYKKIATIKKNKTVSYTKKKLKRKKTYYFKVQAYIKYNGKTYYSKYSSVRKYKLK